MVLGVDGLARVREGVHVAVADGIIVADIADNPGD